MKTSQNKFLFIGIAVFAVIIFIVAYGIYLSQTGRNKQSQKRQANKAIQKILNTNTSQEEPAEEEEENFAFVLQKPVFAEYSSMEEAVAPNFPDEKVEFNEMENIK